MNSGVIKKNAEDFIVKERLDVDFTNEGEHLWCYVEKKNLNTNFVKKRFSELLQCQIKWISHSGLKDKYALTYQWICLPFKYAEGLPDQENFDDGSYWKIIRREVHQKKLRIGTHKTNDFIIKVRDISGDVNEVEKKLNELSVSGYANYFGKQRFGQDNLQRALSWVEKGELPRKHDLRGRILSSLRSACFNEELALREELGLRNRILSGDHLILNGSRSYFVAEESDEALEKRRAEKDIYIAGWLIGEEKDVFFGESLEIRKKALTGQEKVIAFLQQHCQSGWRPFSIDPANLRWEWLDEQESLQIAFSLPAGAYATTLLESLMTITE